MTREPTVSMTPPRDVPPADETTAPWWEATTAHKLVVQQCGSCENTQHPPRSVCISCGLTDRLTWVAASGAGVVDAFTVVHRAPRTDEAVPYVIARVRLEEGVVLLSRLEGRTPDDWGTDQSVQVAWVDLPDGRALPVFRAADTAPAHP